MPAIALVLISTEPGQEQQVVADLKEMREVSEAMVLFGEYDCLLYTSPSPRDPH